MLVVFLVLTELCFQTGHYSRVHRWLGHRGFKEIQALKGYRVIQGFKEYKATQVLKEFKEVQALKGYKGYRGYRGYRGYKVFLAIHIGHLAEVTCHIVSATSA